MPPRKKKIVQKRTPGFTTIDKEIHDLLDTVRPVAERVYRKLHQRVNIKRGDNMVFPTWDQLITDTGISNRRTLDKAIKELESVGLIVVDRSYNKDLQRKNVNQYHIVPANKLIQWQNYQEPVAILQKPSGKSATVTRMKGTRMNITKMKKGKVKSKKEKKGSNSSLPPAQTSLSPDAPKKERSQWQKRTGSQGKFMSVETWGTVPINGLFVVQSQKLFAVDDMVELVVKDDQTGSVYGQARLTKPIKAPVAGHYLNQFEAVRIK